jgi:AraC-like DNA-binding protein
MVSFNSRQPAPAAAFSCALRAPSMHFRADPHAGIELCFVPRGWLTLRVATETIRINAGEVAVFWAAAPHQVVARSDDVESYYVATLSLAWLLAGNLPALLVQALLDGRPLLAPVPAEAGLDAERFACWAADPGETDPEIAHAILLELEARLLRLAWTGTGTRTAGGATPRRPAPADPLADFVARRCTGEVNLRLIAQEFALPQREVSELFQSNYGKSVAEFIACHRIFHAQRLLLTSRANVTSIAAAAGFGSRGQFNRAFLKACGCAPRLFRQAVKTASRPSGSRGH